MATRQERWRRARPRRMTFGTELTNPLHCNGGNGMTNLKDGRFDGAAFVNTMDLSSGERSAALAAYHRTMGARHTPPAPEETEPAAPTVVNLTAEEKRVAEKMGTDVGLLLANKRARVAQLTADNAYRASAANPNALTREEQRMALKLGLTENTLLLSKQRLAAKGI